MFDFETNSNPLKFHSYLFRWLIIFNYAYVLEKICNYF